MAPLYTIDQLCDHPTSKLELIVDKICGLFEHNNLKGDAPKCHFFITPSTHFGKH